MRAAPPYAALYLASDESSWTAGTEFVVDSGITINYVCACDPAHSAKALRGRGWQEKRSAIGATTSPRSRVFAI